jgi:hypothetical protein
MPKETVSYLRIYNFYTFAANEVPELNEGKTAPFGSPNAHHPEQSEGQGAPAFGGQG